MSAGVKGLGQGVEAPTFPATRTWGEGLDWEVQGGFKAISFLAPPMFRTKQSEARERLPAKCQYPPDPRWSSKVP